MQGIHACGWCSAGCYQCAPATLAPGKHTAVAFDVGDMFGSAQPFSVPAPTTSSLYRRIIMWPEGGEGWAFCTPHIEDAERLNVLESGHTVGLPITVHYMMVGNANHAKVSCYA